MNIKILLFSFLFFVPLSTFSMRRAFSRKLNHVGNPLIVTTLKFYALNDQKQALVTACNALSKDIEKLKEAVQALSNVMPRISDVEQYFEE